MGLAGRRNLLILRLSHGRDLLVLRLPHRRHLLILRLAHRGNLLILGLLHPHLRRHLLIRLLGDARVILIRIRRLIVGIRIVILLDVNVVLGRLGSRSFFFFL